MCIFYRSCSSFLPLQLLLEYDDQSWDLREWTCIHQTGVFHVFLVEHDLWWAGTTQQQLCPALVFLLFSHQMRRDGN